MITGLEDLLHGCAFAWKHDPLFTQITSFTAPAALGQLYLISHRGGNRTPGLESNARARDKARDRMEGREKPSSSQLMDAPSNLRCPHIMNILARVQRSASSSATSARLERNRGARGCSEEEEEEEEREINGDEGSGRSEARRRKLLQEMAWR